MTDLQARLRAALGDAYQVERELGGGGMSRVFLATEASLHRAVVIKLLPPEFASEVSEARFKQEIELAAHLQHPNILPVLTAGAKGDLLFYVMPFVSGESLRHRLTREGKLPVADAVRILHEMADALAYAHAEGVIHRDVKPENILLEGGHAVLTDFGVARALVESRSGGRLTDTGLALGTPGYMSPEQAAGERHVDARADVYALAVVGYEMLAGFPPFAGPTAQALIAAHLTATPKPLTDTRPEAPPAVANAIARALAKDPNARLRTAAEFRDALGAGLAHPRDQALRRTGWLVAAGAAIVAVALGGALMSRSRGAVVGVDPKVVAVFPFRVAGAEAALSYLREGMVDLLAAKLTGEGGPRAVDPRAVLSAWRRAGGSAADDLAEEAALRAARSLGAGRLIDGGIVGTPTHITLTALLRSVPGGVTRAQASVEGSPDSLAALIDRLTAQLLARGAGETEQRLPSLTTTSLPALRVYLDGQGEYRRGRYAEAVRHFEEALRLDSAFALAAIGLTSASGWIGATAYSRGIALAWAARDRLSERDRTILAAIAGPHYPDPSSELERLAARERAVAAIPDGADAWYWFGDQYFHWGSVLGLSDGRQRAAAAFQRALELDSTFAGPLEHLAELAAGEGDTAAGRRLQAVAWAADSTGDLAKYLSWRVAVTAGDSGTVAAVRSEMDRMKSFLFNFSTIAQLDGVALPDAERAVTVMGNQASTRLERQVATLTREFLALNRGRPSVALTATEVLRDVELNPHGHLWRTILDALYWDGDTAAAVRAARELARSADRPLAHDVAERSNQYNDMFVLEQWRLAHGQIGTTARAISELRNSASPRDSASTVALNVVRAATLDAMLAAAQHRADASASIEHLDSIMQTGPAAFFPAHEEKNLVVARLRETQGDLKGALAAVRRRVYFLGPALYLSTYLREEGRLAALTGDHQGAIRAYEHYLALRSDPEPSLKPEVDRVRAELAKLVGEPKP